MFWGLYYGTPILGNYQSFRVLPVRKEHMMASGDAPSTIFRVRGSMGIYGGNIEVILWLY